MGSSVTFVRLSRAVFDTERTSTLSVAAGIDAVRAEVTGDRRGVDLLRDLALLHARHLEVVQRLRRHAAKREYVVRHAVRIGAIHHRAAGRHTVHIDDVQ